VTADPNDRFDLSQRTVIGMAAAVGMGVAMSSPASAGPSRGGLGHPIRPVAFDAFTVFDRQPVGAGAALTNAWSVRQFEPP